MSQPAARGAGTIEAVKRFIAEVDQATLCACEKQ
jgi:hypothetical protein